MNQTECSICPANAICPGGNQILVNSGFWRSSLYSVRIYQCFYSEFCLGGTGLDCAASFKGKFCEECEDKFTKKNFVGVCSVCHTDWIYLIMNISFISLGAFFYLTFIWTIISEQFSEERKITIKILINYLQNLYFIPFGLYMKKASLEEYFLIYHYFLGYSSDIFNLDCIFIHFCIYEISLFDKLSLKLFFLILLLNIAFLIYSVYHKINRKKINLKNFWLIFYAWAYVSFPIMTHEAFTPFNCVEIDGSLFILNDLNEECWTINYSIKIFFISFPTLIFWMFWLPLKVMHQDLKNKNWLKNRSPIIKMSKIINHQNIFFDENKNIFFIGYKCSFFDWEKYKYLQNILIVILASLYERGKERIFYSLLIYGITLIFIMKTKPIKFANFGHLENTYFFIILFSYIGLFTSFMIEENQFDLIIFKFTLVINFAFIMSFILCFIFSTKKSFRKCIFSIKNFCILHFLFNLLIFLNEYFY